MASVRKAGTGLSTAASDSGQKGHFYIKMATTTQEFSVMHFSDELNLANRLQT